MNERQTSASRSTIHDVAALAGVSIKTVSRVINSEPRVAPATVAKVQAAVAALGFERNDVARSLRPGHRTQTLGLIMEDLDSVFYPALMRSVDRVAQAHGYMLISASTLADAERERELVTALLRRRIDGLLLVPFTSDQRYISQADGNVPTVVLDRRPRNLRADAVLLDDIGGTEQAVAHFLAQGHRRIAFIGEDAVYSGRMRLATFRQMLAGAGALVEELIVTSSGLIAEAEVGHAETTVRRLLELPADRRPTAILAHDNRVTVGILRALRGQESSVAFVGFDDFEAGELLGVTVVRTDPAEMGRCAAELVLERIAGRADEPQSLVVPTELVVRGSGEIPP
jgi:LacI family transcriptional regulator